VRQLAGLPDAGVEGLAGLVAAFIALVAIRLEEIPPAVGQGNGAVLRADRRRANQPVVLQTLEGSLRALRVVSEVVEIAFGHDAECADGGQSPAFVAVDIVDAVTLADRPTLAAARQVEVLREDVARGTVARIMGVSAAAASSIAVARLFTIPVAFPAWVVPVQHVADSIRAVIRYACRGVTTQGCGSQYGGRWSRLQFTFRFVRALLGGVCSVDVCGLSDEDGSHHGGQLPCGCTTPEMTAKLESRECVG
jgi:hypothetical protein